MGGRGVSPQLSLLSIILTNFYADIPSRRTLKAFASSFIQPWRSSTKLPFSCVSSSPFFFLPIISWRQKDLTKDLRACFYGNAAFPEPLKNWRLSPLPANSEIQGAVKIPEFFTFLKSKIQYEHNKLFQLLFTSGFPLIAHKDSIYIRWN